MVERSHKPSAIGVSVPTSSNESATVQADSERVTLKLATGESVVILLYGGTVISWQTAGQERLFLSDAAKLDGTKAVRGGIPLVFPVFGKSEEKAVASLPQHGFARISKWELLGKTTDSSSHVQVDLGLSQQNLDPEIRQKWSHAFGLIYSVVLGRKTLETKMVVRNEGTDSFAFHVLFHTYLKVPDVTNTSVGGLRGITYADKTQGGATFEESSSTLAIAGETDRVYKSVPGPVTIQSGPDALYRIERSGLDDVVVWNPAETSSQIGDFAPKDGWKSMLCVEAGSVSEWQKLEGGSVWEGGQVISLL